MGFYRTSTMLVLLLVLAAGPAGAGIMPPAPPAPEPAASATQAPAGPAPLTLAEALRLAQEHNAGLKVVEAQEQEAFEAYRSASKLPALQASVNYVGGNNPVPTNNGLAQDYNVSLSQSFGPIHGVALSARVAKQGYEIARLTTGQARIILVQSVKDAFYALISAQEQVAAAEENLGLAQRIYDLAQKRYQAGAAPRMDLLNAGIQLSTARQAVISAQGTLRQARDALNPLLGRAAAAPVAVQGSLEMPTLHLDLPHLRQEAESRQPQVAIARQTLEQSRAQVALARAQVHPTPVVGYSYDLSTSPLYAFFGALQFPLDWGVAHHAVLQQKHTVTEKQAALQAALLSVSLAVQAAYDNYQASQTNAATYHTEVLLPSEQLMNMTRYGYSQGALPYLQVLTAQQNLRTARSQYLALLLAARQALDALEAAVGRTLEGAQP